MRDLKQRIRYERRARKRFKGDGIHLRSGTALLKKKRKAGMKRNEIIPATGDTKNTDSGFFRHPTLFFTFQ